MSFKENTYQQNVHFTDSFFWINFAREQKALGKSWAKSLCRWEIFLPLMKSVFCLIQRDKASGRILSQRDCWCAHYQRAF